MTASIAAAAPAGYSPVQPRPQRPRPPFWTISGSGRRRSLSTRLDTKHRSRFPPELVSAARTHARCPGRLHRAGRRQLSTLGPRSVRARCRSPRRSRTPVSTSAHVERSGTAPSTMARLSMHAAFVARAHRSADRRRRHRVSRSHAAPGPRRRRRRLELRHGRSRLGGRRSTVRSIAGSGSAAFHATIALLPLAGQRETAHRGGAVMIAHAATGEHVRTLVGIATPGRGR